MSSDAAVFRIIIVGGGIAGLCAAIALRKEGRSITVLEQSSLNREIGATISLQPNASRIVEQTWAMHRQLSAIGMPDEGFRIFGVDGIMQKSISLSTSKYGADRVVYHRQDLHEALKTRALDGSGGSITIKTSSRVVQCEPELGSLHLEDGTRMEADLIIGSDGIKSTLRDYVLAYRVPARPTGFSAYRIMVDMPTLEQHEPEFCATIAPKTSMTTMIMAHDRRLIMGPARGGTVYSVVALVPDKRTTEDADNSWTTTATLADVLRDFEQFPDWAKAPFRHAEDIGLWQLRDIEPLEEWHKGRVILIGDAAHAMLPTQGQGASQAIEDAEAVGSIFSDIQCRPTKAEIEARLNQVFIARYERATTIQAYSRQSARPATAKGEMKVNMDPAEFMDYNCSYTGVQDWLKSQQKERLAQESTSNVDQMRISTVEVQC